VAERADVLILAVKPQVIGSVIEEIATSVWPDTIVISIAPGKSISWITDKLGRQVRLIRCMPNTPALVGEGMTGFCVSGNVTEEDKEKAKSILEAFGRAEEVPEELMAAVTSVSAPVPRMYSY
jgi:pyrroline-5-carboxylate reductase